MKYRASSKLSALLLLSLFSSAFSSAQAPVAATPPETPRPADAQDDPVARLNALWKTRDDASSLKESDVIVTQALEKQPTAYELLWRAARIRWWVADGASDDRLKKTYAKQGWSFAERALKEKGDGIEAQYYLALCIGAYSQSVGILKALSEGLESKFVSNLDVVIQKSEGLELGGPRTAKGRYYWELPWPKRDLEKSKAELQKVTAKFPSNLRSHYYLAETLLKDGDKEGAKALLDKVLAASVDYDAPEGRRAKAWAKKLKESM
jgi:tetratricopeptide (TPR) repeat protein